MSEWREVKLSDLLTVSHGWPFKSEHFTSSDVAKSESTPIVVSIGNFDYNGGFDFAGSAVRGYGGEYPAEYVLNATDILLIMTCQTEGGEILGIPARVPADGNVYLHNQRIGRVRIFRQDLLDDDFFYQWARGPIFNRQLFVTASGSKILHTSPSRIGETRIRIPDLHEQRVIAGVLGALDDKIEANRKLAATADDLARALLQSSIRSSSQPMKIDRIARFHNKKRVPLSSRERSEMMGDVPYFGANGQIDSVSTHIFDGEYVLVGEDGTVQETDGSPVLTYITGRSWVNNHAHVLTGESLSTSMLYYLLKTARVDHAITGAVQPKLSMTNLKRVLVAVPEDVGAAARQVDPLNALQGQAQRENKVLAELRDTLLPKLMSGQVRVAEAMELVSS